MTNRVTIQDRNNALVESMEAVTVDKIESSFRPDWFIQSSLIDRGLAGTRAQSIAEALDDKNIHRLTTAILNCDGNNFPLLMKIEPRLFMICLDHETCPALIERMEEVLND